MKYTHKLELQNYKNMIRTKEAFYFQDRGDRFSKIEIEIEAYNTVKTGAHYMVYDYFFDGDIRVIHNEKSVFFSNAQIDGIDAFVEANYDLSGLTKTQKEWKKLQIALMIDTTTNLLPSGKTIYKLTPEDWEFSY